MQPEWLECAAGRGWQEAGSRAKESGVPEDGGAMGRSMGVQAGWKWEAGLYSERWEGSQGARASQGSDSIRLKDITIWSAAV